MDREHKKYQVVFLIDKSLEHAKNFLNPRHDRLAQCDNNPKGEQQSPLNNCPSSQLLTSSCDCETVEDSDQVRSRVWKSISLSALRILCYFFTKNLPGNSNKKDDVSTKNVSAFSLNNDDYDNNEENVCNKQTATNLENKIEYLKKRQSSLQWGYKFFTSNKLPGKTDHHQLKDFKLRHFEEFEKELKKQFEELNDDIVNTKTNPSRKDCRSSPTATERRKSNGPSPSECLKRTLSHVLYDFNWENPDITSPIISRKSSLSKKKRSSNSGHRGSDCSISSGPQNLVFLFQTCPSSKLELRHFAGKMVVDSEVLLDSFMPPSLFKEFVVNRNLSLYWIDHQIHDDIFLHHANVSDYENESFRIVNEALAKLGGTLIPLDSLTVAGSLHWSSIYYNTRWANHLFLDVNSPQQLSQFGNFLEKKSDVDDDFPTLPSNNKSVSEGQNKRSKHQDKGRGLLPVTSVLDHFIKGPYTTASALIKDGGDLTNQPYIEATLGFHQNETQPELCPLMLVPTNSSGTGTLEKFFSCSQSSSSGADVHVSMTDKHKQSRGDSQPNVQFILSSESHSQSSSLRLSSPQASICLQLEVYSYLRRSDVCSTSDYTFFCTVCIQRLSKFNANKKSDNPKSSTLNSYAKFQSLLLRLTEADQNLVLTVKLDGQSTPFLAVLQPLSVSLGLIVFFPMGLSLNLENHLVCKSNDNVTKETNPADTFQLEPDDLDYITQRFAKRLWHPKYIPQSFEMHTSDVNVRKEVSKLNVFDSAVLNKWNLPCNNPEMVKMSMSFDKNIDTNREACVTRETNLFKQLKSFYRQADSPSQLVNKKQQQEEEKKLAESVSEETACQNAGGEPKPRILQKLRSFTLGPTRAEMILSKSMQVVEQQSKVDKDDSIGMSQSSRLSLETESQALAVVKQIDDELSLSSFIKEFYESTITNNLNSWNRMHRMVAIVHMYMKERSKENPEAEAKKFLEEQVYLSSFSLRQKYQDSALSTKKQDKILEYQLQIILRMEMLSYLKLSSEDQETNEDEEPEDNEESIVDSFVDEIVTMLRTLSFIADAAIVPVFLNDVLLKNYTDTLMHPLADIYNELLQPLPSVLATSADSPETSIPSSFCPSTVGTCILDETTRDGFPENGTTQAKRAKAVQVVPGLGEGVKRQIVVGKKPAATAKQNNPTKNKKTEENHSKEKVRARRSLFMSEKRNLERHRSFAVRDKDKPRSHQKQRHSHRFSSKHSTAKSSSAQKRSKTMVAETPAHKQISQVMRRWHLLQSRLTEPMQNTPPVCAEINTTPKRAKPDMTVSIIEESPLKEGIAIPKLSENCKKTTVLIRRAFYGSQNEKSQSRNLTKYLELADRIAGRHDRYAQLTDLSTVSQMNQNIQSPVDKPSSFALSQLMGSPSTSSPRSLDSTVLKYTPNRKSPSFPFSTSPKFSNKTSERISVKQALFRTPEKNVAKSQTLHSSNLSTQSPCSSKNQSSVRNKLALLSTPPNGSKCIFKTPTKEPMCIFKSPDKTPTSKKFNTTPVKSYAQMLVRKSDRKQKLTNISTDEPQYPDGENRNLHGKALFKSQDLCSTNILIASHQLPSKSSPISDSLEATTGDDNINFSSSNSKLKKLTFNQDDNNNSTTDQSSVIPLHSSPLKLLPSASLSQCSGKKRLKTLQPDASWENKDSVVPQDKCSSLGLSNDESKPKGRRKRKNLSEIVSEASSPLKSKRQRRSLSSTLHKHEDTKEDQANKSSRNQPPRGKNLYANRTRRSTAIQRD